LKKKNKRRTKFKKKTAIKEVKKMTCNEQIQPGDIFKDKIVDLISCRLCNKDSIPVAFPPCSDVL
jgi:hypothetical protein